MTNSNTIEDRLSKTSIIIIWSYSLKDNTKYQIQSQFLSNSTPTKSSSDPKTLTSYDQEPFQDVQITPDEKIYITRRLNYIECYNMNNSRLHIIPIDQTVNDFKLLCNVI